MSLLRHSIEYLAGCSVGRRALDGIRRRGSPIFMFHRVLEPNEPCYSREMVTTVPIFQRFLEWLQERYEVVPLSVLLERIGDPALCSITFDDGWEDNYRCAFPLLRQAAVPASIFLITSYVGTSIHPWQEDLWRCCEALSSDHLLNVLNDVARLLPWCPIFSGSAVDFSVLREFLLRRSTAEAKQFVGLLYERVDLRDHSKPSFMNWNQVAELSRHGITFGSHTMRHSLLTRTTLANASDELRGSRRELEQKLGKTIEEFAYPWGAMNAWVRQLVHDTGYRRAVSIREAYGDEGSDPLALPRIFISDTIITENKIFRPEKMSIHMAKMGLRRRKSNRAHTPVSPLRICFVVDEIKDWHSGTEQQFRRVLDALTRSEFEVRICVLRRTNTLEEARLPFPVAIISDRPQNAIAMCPALVAHLKHDPPDIVQTFFPDANSYGTIAARLAGVPTIVNSRRSLGYWQGYRDRIMLAVSNRLATYWQCNSRAVRDWLIEREHVPPDKIEILPNCLGLVESGLPSPEERFSARKSLGISASATVLVSVANLRPVKQLETLIRAIPIVLAKIPNLIVLFVGEGECEAKLRKEAEQCEVTAHIRFEGAQAEVRRYLAAADIGILTSSSEGSSNALLEYMAMGLPAVVSDIAANRELVSEAVFALGNVENLAQSILELLRDPKRCKRLRKQYRMSAEEYSQTKFEARLQSYYLSLISESKPY